MPDDIISLIGGRANIPEPCCILTGFRARQASRELALATQWLYLQFSAGYPLFTDINITKDDLIKSQQRQHI